MALFSKLFSGRPEIELRTFDPEDNSILFSCARELAPGEYDAQAQVADHKMRCKVRVDSLQAGLHYGEFLEPRAALQHLAVLLPVPLHRQEKRSANRVERGLRVSSQRIPRYLAISRDFSASGIKLKTEGPMQVGDEFEAQIEFDDETMARLDVLCKVVWCRAEEDKFLVGASFENLSKPAAARIAYFVQDLTRVERGVVTGIYQFD
jgi:hypothetical protein